MIMDFKSITILAIIDFTIIVIIAAAIVVIVVNYILNAMIREEEVLYQWQTLRDLPIS